MENCAKELEWEVLIPAYNAQDTILAAVSSALAQMPRPSNVWIYDDCSTDDTVARVSAEFPECKMIQGRPNRGVGFARQALLEKSSSTWILILDADDILDQSAGKKFVAAVADNSECSVIGFSDQITAQAVVANSTKSNFQPITYRQIWWRNRFISSATLIRRSAALGAGGFSNERRLVDYDLWLRMFKNSNVTGIFCSQNIVERTISASTITANVVPAVKEQLRLLETIGREDASSFGWMAWDRRVLELWGRGYVRHIRYGKSFSTYLSLNEVCRRPIFAVIDPVFRNRVTELMLQARMRRKEASND